jgi:hypothetical protein
MPKSIMRPCLFEPIEQVLPADVVAPIAPATPAPLFRLTLPDGGRYVFEAMIAGEMLAATTGRTLTIAISGARLSYSQLASTIARVNATAVLNALTTNTGVPVVAASFSTSFSATITRGNLVLTGVLTAAAGGDVVVTASAGTVPAEVCTIKAGSHVRATYLRPAA